MSRQFTTRQLQGQGDCRAQHLRRQCKAPTLQVRAAAAKSMDVDVAIVGGGCGLCSTPTSYYGPRSAVVVETGPTGRPSWTQPDPTIQVFERRHSNDHGGAAVGLHVNGLRALEAIHPSLAHRMYGQGTYSADMQFRNDRTGELLSQARVDTLTMAKMLEYLQVQGHTQVLVRWQDMVSVLRDSLPQETITYGCKLLEAEELSMAGEREAGDAAAAGGSGEQQHSDATPQPGAPSGSSGSDALEQLPYRYQLRFSCGGVEGEQQQQQSDGAGEGLGVRAKFVVGADGYYSRVRRMLGDGGSPTFIGTVAWWGSLTEQQAAEGGVDTWPEGLDAEAGVCSNSYDGPDRVVLMQRNVGRDVIWYMRTKVEELQAAGLEYPCRSSGAVALDRALRTFSHLPAPVLRVLAATPPARVTERGLHMHDFGAMGEGSWARGSVCLVGDAAHCGRPDGQGANLALEDAAELAARVREHGLGEQAFRAFESSRMQRVRTILSDAAPPFAVRTPLILSASFAPLWSPADLPVPVASVEEGMAWSRGVVREVVERQMFVQRQQL